MEEDNNLFGREKIGKLLVRFSIPIIISLLVSELYNMVDTLFVGRYVSEKGIGALVLVFPIQRIIIALSMMIGIGTSTAFSRALGAKEDEKSKKIVRNGFTLAIVIMLTLTGLVYFKAEPILRGLGASDSILPYAMDYLSIIILGSTFLSLTIFTSNIMISTGNSRVSIASTSIGAVLNVIIDYVLVKELGFGVKGAAIATTLSQIAGFSYAYYNLRKLKKEHGIKTGLELNPKIFMPIVLVGISAFIIEAEDGILMGVLNKLLSAAVGDSAIIVLGVISKLYMFLFVTMFGIASAMQPIAAYNAGANNYARLKEVMRKTTVYATLSTAVLWAIGMVFTEPIVKLFVMDPEIVAESVIAFRIMIAVFPLISVYYVSIFYFQSIGKPRYSVSVSILRQLVIMMPLSIIMVKAFNMGAMGVWLSYPIADLISTGISFVLIRKESNKLTETIKKEKKKKEKQRLKEAYI